MFESPKIAAGLRVKTVHDELIFEAQDDYVSQLASVVRKVMTTVMPLSVPLKVDIKHGGSWAACELL